MCRVVGQNSDKFGFTVGYGVVRNSFETRSDFQNLGYETPKYGKAFQFSLDIKLSDNRFMGLGYSLQSTKKTLNTDITVNVEGFEQGVGILWQNYRLENEAQFYELYYRQKFNKRINATLGFFYYRRFNGNLFFDGQQYENKYFVIRDSKPRADDIGLFLALDYLFPIKNYVEIGLQAKVFYSFSGIEAITVAPIVRFNL